ncbi:MAG: anthranilate synthase component I family protein [Myxococcales bacterium]|nr:anthranilate synthase component I family protein [Myxococcales bacterium]
MHPSREGFLAQAAQGSPVQPVWCEVLDDGETPVAAFARLRAHGAAGLLESVVGGERWARYSFVVVGARARVVGRWEHDALRVELRPGEGFCVPPELREGEGLPALRRIFEHYRAPSHPDQPPLWGGLVGAWGHDLVRCFEHLPAPPGRAPAGVAAVDLVVTDTVVVFDTLTQRVRLVTAAHVDDDGGPEAAYEAARERLARVREALLHAPPALRVLEPDEHVPFATEPAPPWSREGYLRSVRAAKEHVVAGDVFQVVLAQGFELPRGDVDVLDVYRILRMTNPAPYMVLLELATGSLAGASPEVLVRLHRDTRRITVRPIAGTRPRGATEAEDLALERELLADPKERAEHLMLIDLGRNDVGRVAEGGSVHMTERFAVERYSKVMHIVSEVVGTLAPGLDALDALRATFPQGTLSGAPKVRALQLIDELEPAERGWYGGAVGYVGFDGGADFAICIRSALALPDRFRVQAGAGIVFDSDPHAEDTECRNKAAAVLRAIAMAGGKGA